MISKDTKNTGKIAEEFLNKIKPAKTGATIVGLYGELGAGKTAFTQAAAKLLGIKTKVKSPTFVIMKSYKLNHPKYEKLVHLDAYRLKNEKELFPLGWEEIIANPKNLVFIEWPEQVIKAMPQKHHKVFISHLSRRSRMKAGAQEEYRKFKIKNL